MHMTNTMYTKDLGCVCVCRSGGKPQTNVHSHSRWSCSSRGSRWQLYRQVHPSAPRLSALHCPGLGSPEVRQCGPDVSNRGTFQTEKLTAFSYTKCKLIHKMQQVFCKIMEVKARIVTCLTAASICPAEYSGLLTMVLWRCLPACWAIRAPDHRNNSTSCKQFKYISQSHLYNHHINIYHEHYP